MNAECDRTNTTLDISGDCNHTYSVCGDILPSIWRVGDLDHQDCVDYIHSKMAMESNNEIGKTVREQRPFSLVLSRQKHTPLWKDNKTFRSDLS